MKLTLKSVDRNDVEKFGGVLVVPEQTTEISAFCCMGLPVKKIIFPTTINRIGNKAFEGCTLKKIEINASSVTIETEAFANNPYLEEVKIKGKEAYIHLKAFESCPSLKRIYIPEGNKIDPWYVFGAVKNPPEIIYTKPNACTREK